LMQVARELVKAGADIILGSHSHVAQPPEVLFVNGYEQRLTATVALDEALTIPEGAKLKDGTGKQRKAFVVYSLGNLTTAMRTFTCRAATMSHLTVGKDPETSDTDWHLPGIELFYNEATGRGVRLRTMASHLRDHPDHAGAADTLMRDLVGDDGDHR